MKIKIFSCIILIKFFSLGQNVVADPSFNCCGVYYTLTSIIQPDGKILVGKQSVCGSNNQEIVRLNVDGSLDNSFNLGLNSYFPSGIITMAIQADGKIIVGGVFYESGQQPYSIVRLNSNGSYDTTFQIGSGFSNPSNPAGGEVLLRDIKVLDNGKILVGGFFSSYNTIARKNIVLLNSDGSIDLTFDPGSGFSDTLSEGDVRSLAIQSDGKIIVGGSFTTFNGNNHNRIVRLNPNGTLDINFNSGSGFDGNLYCTVTSLDIQPDGKIVVGGYFSSFNGTLRNNFARLSSNGSLDSFFAPLEGFNNIVWTSCIQPDGKIIVAGDFSTFNGTNISRIARLNINGSLDNTFDPGTSVTYYDPDLLGIYSLALQTDGKIIITGGFSAFNGVTQYGISRLVVCEAPVFQTISTTSCLPYISPTNQSYTVSGTYNEAFFNMYGCDSVLLEINLTILNSESSFSETICNGDTYTWNNQQYTQAGQYTQTLTNQFGCDSVVTLNLNVNYNDYISITQNPAFGNAPLNVAFANQTQNLSNYNFTWYFGDGTSQQSNAPFLSHTYTQDGYADVTVVAENLTTGCSSSQTFDDMIFVIGGVTCTHTATLNQSGPLNACAGNSVLLSCNTDPSFSYQWNRNGIPVSGATSSSFYPTQSGSYTVTIYQNNCPVTSNGISVTINPLPNIPTITSSGTIVPCSGGSITLTAPSGLNSYLWNTGNTSNNLVVSQSGNYSVSVTNSNGCSRTSDPFAVNASNMAPPQVCIVGVDSLTNENRVVWEKPLTFGIDSFYVYKESNVSNVYSKIGATDYNDLAVFLDANSNPAVQAYRYKISALDTCGVETNVGEFHKTIHLTINAGVGGAWNLIWSHYEGLTFGSYKIYRGTDPSNISLLTTIQSNLNSYSDLTPPTGPLYYQIEVVNPNNCDPTKILNYGVSRSNIVNNGVSGVKEIVNTNILVYPNPTIDFFYLKSNQSQVGNTFEIVDNAGRIVISGVLQNDNQSIDVSKLSRGIYNLNVIGSESKTMKLVKD